jgi:hypothetical protein
MALHDCCEWDGAFLAGTDSQQRFFGRVRIFEIVDVLHDCFLNVESLGSAGTACESIRRRSIDLERWIVSISASHFRSSA